MEALHGITLLNAEALQIFSKNSLVGLPEVIGRGLRNSVVVLWGNGVPRGVWVRGWLSCGGT